MGYQIVPPPALGTYPTIEKSRTLRWSAFEECGVRQVMRVSTIIPEDKPLQGGGSNYPLSIRWLTVALLSLLSSSPS